MTDNTPSNDSTVEVPDEDSTLPASTSDKKGRPTPKRKDQEAANRRTLFDDPKAAKKADREKARLQREREYQAMREGDDYIMFSDCDIRFFSDPEPDITRRMQHFDFIAQDDKVVVLGFYRWRVKATGRTYSAKWAHVLTLRDGKIVGFTEYTDTAAMAAAMQS